MSTEPDPDYDWEEQVVPYVQGELNKAERRRFEAVMAESSLCRLRVYDVRRCLEELRSVPREKATGDLHARILSAFEDEQRTARSARVIRFPWPMLVRVAASLVLAVGIWSMFRRGVSSSATSASDPIAAVAGSAQEAARRGLDWLASAQEPSGAWDGMRWGSSRHYTTGLTGLAVLALADSRDSTTAYGDTIDRGIAFLLGSQGIDGTFGESENIHYEHAIATCALLEVYKRQPSAPLKKALDAALPVVARDARAYRRGPGAMTSPATAWSTLALQLAARGDWPEYAFEGGNGVGASSRKFVDIAESGSDLQRIHMLFFAGYADAGDALLAEMRMAVMSAQVKDGPHAGSWNLSGRIEAEGGRIYATSMAALALNAGAATGS